MIWWCVVILFSSFVCLHISSFLVCRPKQLNQKHTQNTHTLDVLLLFSLLFNLTSASSLFNRFASKTCSQLKRSDQYTTQRTEFTENRKVYCLCLYAVLSCAVLCVLHWCISMCVYINHVNSFLLLAAALRIT